MIIYKITNKINGKIYVGCTRTSLELRLKRHWLRRKDARHLTRSMVKYGIENFSIEEIESVSTEEEMFEREIFWIAELNSNDYRIGYNMTIGGDNPPIKRGKENANYGRKNPMLAEMGRACKGKKLSEETKKKIAIACSKRVHSQYSKEKMSKSRRIAWESGVYSSEEYRKKLGASKAGKPSPKRKPILCVNDNKIYDGIISVCKQFPVSSGNVCNVLNGKYKHTKGYAFQYA